MFLDASAVVAIIKREPGFEALIQRAADSPTALVFSPLSRFEAVVSLARAGAGLHRSATHEQIKDSEELVDRLYLQLGAENLDLTHPIGTGAIAAAQTYGRCVGHPAGLNLGDCFAYACAKDQRVPLLYKGDDFATTDLA